MPDSGDCVASYISDKPSEPTIGRHAAQWAGAPRLLSYAKEPPVAGSFAHGTLKVKLQRQLHRAISARARDFSKVRRIVHRSTWRRPRRMVGQVVGLGAKLDPHSLDWMERLEQRKIDVH